MASNQRTNLTAAELSEIAQYGKIVKFAQNVLLGKHPRVKVPVAMQARARMMGQAMLQESGAEDGARNSSSRPAPASRFPAHAVRMRPVDKDVKLAMRHAEGIPETVVLNKRGPWKAEVNMARVSKRKAEVEAAEQIKAKRGRMENKEENTEEKESDDESTLGIFDGETGRKAEPRYSWRDNQGKRHRRCR